jgi:hypothetical protein
MKKIFFYVIIFVVFIVGLYFLGTRIMAVIGLLLAALGITKKREDKYKEAKNNINKAGENVEAKKHNANSALDFFDDFFSDDDGPGDKN